MKKSHYDEPWFVYIAECKDKTLYTGIAVDVDKRIEDHNTTNKCRYTRFRKPLELKYKEPCANYNVARKREVEIKRFSREKKYKLINSIS
jgi:putative endonuclease